MASHTQMLTFFITTMMQRIKSADTAWSERKNKKDFNFYLRIKSFQGYPQLYSTAMSSIAITVLQPTIGLLFRKGRDKVVEILKDGDITDQKFFSLIVLEIDEIKSKLDALSRKDLKASVSFFEEGIALLYEVFNIANTRSVCGAVTAQAACNEAFPLIEGIRRLEITGLDESATRKLSTAKKRFEDARRKATEAFHNESLETSDRILAMKYRVMATILETVEVGSMKRKEGKLSSMSVTWIVSSTVSREHSVETHTFVHSVLIQNCDGFFEVERITLTTDGTLLLLQ